jgi:transposase-like protein
MTDTEAEAMFRKVRWPETDGAPVCPRCGGVNAYECRRPNGLLRFRCRACRGDFTITSGTLFAFHKLPLRGYLAAIAIFCNGSCGFGAGDEARAFSGFQRVLATAPGGLNKAQSIS